MALIQVKRNDLNEKAVGWQLISYLYSAIAVALSMTRPFSVLNMREG